MKLAVIGATGLVGSKIRKLLAERNFSFTKLYLAASEKSVGKKLEVGNNTFTVSSIPEVFDKNPDIALFSAGGDVSKKWVEKFANNGTYVVDNSSVFRMKKNIPLVVPEINASSITAKDKIITNPNCSTIQMVMVLYPLHKKFKIKRVVVSTYQSVTGTGQQAVHQMFSERDNIESEKIYPYAIDKNCIPHCDIFLENSYTKEEMKLVNETRKILKDASIRITATAVRVPVIGGHSESINLQLKKEFSLSDIYKILDNTSGVTVTDDVKNNKYPMPLTAYEKDDVFVGRIRRDESQKKSLNLWVVSDNIRKGAATNAVQIAEYIKRYFF